LPPLPPSEEEEWAATETPIAEAGAERTGSARLRRVSATAPAIMATVGRTLRQAESIVLFLCYCGRRERKREKERERVCVCVKRCGNEMGRKVRIERTKVFMTSCYQSSFFFSCPFSLSLKLKQYRMRVIEELDHVCTYVYLSVYATCATHRGIKLLRSRRQVDGFEGGNAKAWYCIHDSRKGKKEKKEKGSAVRSAPSYKLPRAIVKSLHLKK
jgi:hypothetical protein